MSFRDDTCKQTRHELGLRLAYIDRAMDIMEQEPLDIGTVENLRKKLGIGSLCPV